MGESLHHTPAHLLPEAIGDVLRVLSSLVKPRLRLPGIDSSKVALHQGEGLFNVFHSLFLEEEIVSRLSRYLGKARAVSSSRHTRDR